MNGQPSPITGSVITGFTCTHCHVHIYVVLQVQYGGKVFSENLALEIIVSCIGSDSVSGQGYNHTEGDATRSSACEF